MAPGRLDDTYVAALQHDLVDVPDDARLVGVIRRPPPWARPYLDENLPALGPPPDLLDDFRDREAELLDTGLDELEAHNTAWDDVSYPGRFRSHLDDSEDAKQALDRVRDLLSGGTDVYLVCFENTDDKHCHRTLLVERLRE